MKSLISIITLLMLNLIAFGQGVNFEHITFDEALAKAKAENKLVFMDCYTSWCGPCKYMTETIFPQEKAGEFFNPKFVCVKYDMEKGEGPELAKRFGVRAYPTFLILRPDGTVQHKIVGGGDLDKFIAKVEKGLNEKTSLDYLNKIYEKGKMNKKQLMTYSVVLNEAYEKDKSEKVGKELDAVLKEKDKMKNIAVIGSGSWGMALAIHLARCGNNVKVWSFLDEERDLINNERKCKFLPNVEIPDNIICSTNFEEVIKDTEFILHVTPSKFTRDIFKQYKQFVGNKPVIICSKGFEKETLKTLDEVIKEEMPEVRLGVLSGPSHAEEVSVAVPTVLVIASKDEEILEMIQKTFMCPEMRIYTSSDVKGVELGGALKNIIAFCAGVASGIGLGDNTFAALVTRGLGELTRLGVALGGEKDTFYGLSGLGDLIVTCLSEHSRNRKAGKLIGQGKTLEEAKKEVGMVIESIDNIEVAYELGRKNNVYMPIVEMVYKVIYEQLDPQEAVKNLMTRDRKSE